MTNFRYGYPQRKHRPGWVTGAILAFILLVFVFAGDYFFQHLTLKTYTFVVKDKAVLATDDGNGGVSHQYTIYTTKGVFKDKDSIWFLKFNSSDLYGNLKVGSTYTCKTTGFRLPLTSTYRNLISCDSTN